MSGVNETIFPVQHESCDYKYRLNGRVCNSKLKWSHNKWRFDCKQLGNQSSCEEG